jgi:hypothetical protein
MNPTRATPARVQSTRATPATPRFVDRRGVRSYRVCVCVCVCVCVTTIHRQTRCPLVPRADKADTQPTPPGARATFAAGISKPPQPQHRSIDTHGICSKSLQQDRCLQHVIAARAIHTRHRGVCSMSVGAVSPALMPENSNSSIQRVCVCGRCWGNWRGTGGWRRGDAGGCVSAGVAGEVGGGAAAGEGLTGDAGPRAADPADEAAPPAQPAGSPRCAGSSDSSMGARGTPDRNSAAVRAGRSLERVGR